jgi:hypothetical protein
VILLAVLAPDPARRTDTRHARELYPACAREGCAGSLPATAIGSTLKAPIRRGALRVARMIDAPAPQRDERQADVRLADHLAGGRPKRIEVERSARSRRPMAEPNRSPRSLESAGQSRRSRHRRLRSSAGLRIILTAPTRPAVRSHASQGGSSSWVAQTLRPPMIDATQLAALDLPLCHGSGDVRTDRRKRGF